MVPSVECDDRACSAGSMVSWECSYVLLILIEDDGIGFISYKVKLWHELGHHSHVFYRKGTCVCVCMCLFKHMWNLEVECPSISVYFVFETEPLRKPELALW